jgi:hypothetical protein
VRLEIAAIATEKIAMAGRLIVGRQIVARPVRMLSRCAIVAMLAAVAAMAPLPQVLAQTSVQTPAQLRSLVAPQSLTDTPLAPGTGYSYPGSTIVMPAPSAPPATPPVAQAIPVPAVPAGHVALAVAARYGQNAPAINGGLIWRVYAAKPDDTGVFRLIKEDRGATPTFMLPPGNYVVHASLGLASAAKAVALRSDAVHEIFDIPAGGIRLGGKVGDVRIPGGQISFEIYTGSQFDTSDRRPIAQNVLTGDVVLLPEGTYYIVSNYGDGNSVVRSDVHVDAGKLTDIVVTHRAAVITLKLVNNPGGEALANTQWTVLTPGGDVIKESIGAFPRLVLAEGDYHVIARNEGKTYQRDFKVITGVDGEVEVLAR